jgi:hypothetical protein
MIEKFGYTISKQDNIKIYRAVGEMKVNNKGESYFEPNLTKVPRTYKYELSNRLFPTVPNWRTSYKQPTSYDSRTDAENAAKEVMRNRLIARIEQSKKEMREAEAMIDNMKIKYYDCGK